MEPLGNVTLLHVTDSHATLRPVFYREPDTLIGVGAERGKPPYLTGAGLFLRVLRPRAGHGRGLRLHLRWISRPWPPATDDGRLRASRHPGPAHPRRARRAHAAARRRRHAPGLGHRAVEPRRGHGARHQPARASTSSPPHWEFTYGIARVRELWATASGKGLLDGRLRGPERRGGGLGRSRPFRPYAIREVGGVADRRSSARRFRTRPIAHPRRFVPDLTFGIREDRIQALVDELRDERKVDLVVLPEPQRRRRRPQARRARERPRRHPRRPHPRRPAGARSRWAARSSSTPARTASS